MVAPKEPEMRVVRHALVDFISTDTKERTVIFRNQSVDINRIPKDRLKDLEAHDAFAPEGTEVGDVPNLGVMSEFKAGFSDVELVAWVRDAGTEEIISAAQDNLDEVQRILDAEAEVAEAQQRPIRQGVEIGLRAVVAAANT